MQDLDVAVIGAGAAGLAAGTVLRGGGVRFAVFEAAGRIGGRAYTDATSFEQPWDLGCHWLHSADRNPFTAIADRLGFSYLKRDRPLLRHVHTGAGWANGEEVAQAAGLLDGAFEAMIAAGTAERDVAATAVIPDAGRWAPLVRHWLSLITAAFPEDISTADYAAYSDTGHNWPVLEGYGALVAAHGADVPVALNCPVTAIDRSGRDLVLTTAQGTVRARAVIIAVPTSVLARGAIAVRPGFPPDLEDAFAALPLGVVEKVAIGFDRDLFGFDERTGVSTFDSTNSDRAPVNFQILPGARPVVVAHLAGPSAARLVAEGAAALAIEAVEALVRAFGADVRRHIVTTRATSWTADPHIGGGYSCALPGKAHLRTRLSEPYDARIHFAGEAVSRHDFSTCHGAHLTGLAAAKAALAGLETSPHG